MRSAEQVSTARVSGRVLRHCARRSIFARAASLVFCLLIAATIAFGQTPAEDKWLTTQTWLTRLLEGNSEQKRTALAEIRNHRSEQASRLAIPALADSDEMVRATAASSVVFLPEAEAARILTPLLKDKQPFVRREAAYALGMVGNCSATSALRRVMNTDRDLEVRAAAAAAIGNIGDDSAIDDLLNVLGKRPKEEEEFLRRSAARSIGQIFELRFTGRTASLTPQNFLPPKLKELGDPAKSTPLADAASTARAVTTLSGILRNSNEADDTRREAAFALGATRQRSAAALLNRFTSSPDPYLAEISKEALLKIEDRQ